MANETFWELVIIDLRDVEPQKSGSANLNRDNSDDEKLKTISDTGLVVVLDCVAPGIGKL